ncbi:fas-binding factor 1 [Leptosomus discolor]
MMKPVLEGRNQLTKVLGSSDCSGMFFWFLKVFLKKTTIPITVKPLFTTEKRNFELKMDLSIFGQNVAVPFPQALSLFCQCQCIAVEAAVVGFAKPSPFGATVTNLSTQPSQRGRREELQPGCATRHRQPGGDSISHRPARGRRGPGLPGPGEPGLRGRGRGGNRVRGRLLRAGRQRVPRQRDAVRERRPGGGLAGRWEVGADVPSGVGSPRGAEAEIGGVRRGTRWSGGRAGRCDGEWEPGLRRAWASGSGRRASLSLATKPKKSLRGSIDDVLDDLLGYGDEMDAKSARASQPAARSSGRGWGTSSQASKKSFLEDDFFDTLPAAEDVGAAEGSSASRADPQALLQTLKDGDDVDADLLGISKRGSGRGKTTVKGDSVPAMEKKPLSSPSASRQYKKFNFEDLDDPLAGLLSDEEQDAPKKLAPTGTQSSSEKKPEESKEKEPPPPHTPLCSVAPVRRRKELTFEDDGDDLMDALGLGSGPTGDEKQGKKAEEEELRPARSKLDELLGRGSVAKILEKPGMGERREFKLDKKYEKQPEKEEGWDEEDFVFGAYQPTAASLPKGQPARRQSVSRFSAETSSELKPEPCSKPPPPASQSSARGRRSEGDWLGLKDEDFMDSELPSPAKASPAVCRPSPAPAGQPGPSSQLPAAEEAAPKADSLEEESWLTTALARKKAQAQAKAQERSAKEAPGEGLHPRSPASQPAASPGAPQQAGAPQDKAASTGGSRQPVPWLSTTEPASAHPSEAPKGDPSRDSSALAPTALFPGGQERQGPAPLAQVATPRVPLQAAPQLQAESPALGLLHEKRLGEPAAQLCEDASGCRAALLAAQARVAELESQVRTLEIERGQHKLLLESLQQRHQEDLDHLESTHRSQMKVLEETYGKREERLRQEKEQLAAQLLSQSQEAERARAELLVQHQQRLAALEQQHTQEVERLRELQRVSVQELRKDHEEQLQRLKRVKEQEIEAVTSAVSHTRSLNGITEQMQKLSSHLQDLSRQVEATQHTTSQELAVGAQQQDKQLKVLQELSERQRDMKEERGRLQEAMAKMEARLGERTQLLEQEKAELKLQGQELKAKEQQLARDRELLHEAWQELRLEKEKVTRATLRIRQQEEEMKSMTQLSSQKYEQGERALQEARRIEAEHQTRLQVMQRRLEQLQQQEQHLHQERLSMAQQRRQLEQLREELPLPAEQALSAPTKGLSSPPCKASRALLVARDLLGGSCACVPLLRRLRMFLGAVLGALYINFGFPSVAAAPPGQGLIPGFPPPARAFPWHRPGCSTEALATAGPTGLYAALLLLKHEAQQDHNFLEDEQIFLENLKKASYKTWSLPG